MERPYVERSFSSSVLGKSEGEADLLDSEVTRPTPVSVSLKWSAQPSWYVRQYRITVRYPLLSETSYLRGRY